MKIIKYVINEDGMPILFSSKKLHSKVIEKAISAGYAIVYYDLILEKFIVKCYGGSDCLKLNVKKEDCFIIQKYLNSLFFNTKTHSIKKLELIDNNCY